MTTNLDYLKEINTGKLKNAERRVEVYSTDKKLKLYYNAQMLDEATEDLMFHRQLAIVINNIYKWYELLKIDGGNTKHQVLVDIEKLIGYSNIKDKN